MLSYRALGVGICIGLACFEIGGARAATSLWDHNGSTVYLMADGATREFHYNVPRAGMLQAGARSGSRYSRVDLLMGAMSEPHTFSTVNVGRFHIRSVDLSWIITSEWS
jgi:hypothetical protein